MAEIYTQADLDRAAQEARAAALQEVRRVLRNDLGNLLYECAEIDNAILALLDTPAAEALERVRAEERRWAVELVRKCIYHDSAGTGFDEDKFDAAIRARGET